MSQKVAVIASILKPVNDTRMFEKLGLSMRETNKYQVNIIGFGVKTPPVSPGISFHELYRGKRTGFGRFTAPFRFLQMLIRLRPDLTVTCTPELLAPAVLYKLIATTCLWYDVQENYRKNVRYQQVYPTFLKPILQAVIWLIETFSRPFVDHYLLAEKGYASELGFINGKHMVLENKYQGSFFLRMPSSKQKTTLVFTGTCSSENGILEAVKLAEEMFACGYPIELIVAGNIPDRRIYHQIQSRIKKGYPIQLIGDGSLVPHPVIMERASSADFGLVAHQPNPSTENCIPTKIYEYLGLRLPMIIQTQPLWESVVEPYQAGLVIEYHNFNPHNLWWQMNNLKFYTKNPGLEISWKQEAKKLRHQLQLI